MGIETSVLRAALRLAAERMRMLPQREPDAGGIDPLVNAMSLEGVSDDQAAEVEKLARVLEYFADSVRIAERKGRPIVPLLYEKIPPAPGQKGPQPPHGRRTWMSG